MTSQINEYKNLENHMAFTCELGIAHWLQDNFHPLIAKYVYMCYVVNTSNQTMESGFLDASSDGQLGEHLASYGDGGQLTLKHRLEPRQVIDQLLDVVLWFNKPLSVHCDFIDVITEAFTKAGTNPSEQNAGPQLHRSSVTNSRALTLRGASNGCPNTGSTLTGCSEKAARSWQR